MTDRTEMKSSGTFHEGTVPFRLWAADFKYLTETLHEERERSLRLMERLRRLQEENAALRASLTGDDADTG